MKKLYFARRNSKKIGNEKNILIIEAYTDANIGSGALLENTVYLLRDMYPNYNIRVMAHYPQAFRDLCGVDAVEDVFKYPFGLSKTRQVVWLIWTCVWMTIVWLGAFLLPNETTLKIPLLKDKLKDFIWADMVVSVGAERINDKFFKNIFFSLFTYDLIHRLRRKMVIFPSTIGPFLFSWTKFLSARVLGNVDLIFTRDNRSQKITQSLPGIRSDNIVNTADVAVMQKSITKEQALKMIPATPQEKLVGISVMKWTYFKNRIETPYSNYPAYVREVAFFADTLIDEYGVTVVLYPTNFLVNGCREDDVSTAIEIRNMMTNSSNVRVIEKLPTPSQFKGMLACSELNVTTRMHACILSTGAFVPTISINYLFKLAEYMDSLGLADFSIDIEEFCAEKALIAFRKMWPDREKWHQHLEQAIHAKQKNLTQALGALDAVISE